MKRLALIATPFLLTACSAPPDYPSKAAALAECRAHLERVHHHPDEQFYWNHDGNSTVLRKWCELDEDYSQYTKKGFGTVIPHLRYRNPSKTGLEACPNTVCTIYPGYGDFSYPLESK